MKNALDATAGNPHDQSEQHAENEEHREADADALKIEIENSIRSLQKGGKDMVFGKDVPTGNSCEGQTLLEVQGTPIRQRGWRSRRTAC